MALNFDRGFVPFRFVSFGLCLEGAFFRGGRCFGEFVPFPIRPFACAVRGRGRGIFPFGENGKSGSRNFSVWRKWQKCGRGIFPFGENGKSVVAEFFRLAKMAKVGLRNFSVWRKWQKCGRGIFPFGENGKSGLTEFFRLVKMAKVWSRNFSVWRKWQKSAYGIFPFGENGKSGTRNFSVWRKWQKWAYGIFPFGETVQGAKRGVRKRMWQIWHLMRAGLREWGYHYISASVEACSGTHSKETR